MKTIIFICSVVALLFLASCQKQDSSSPNAELSILDLKIPENFMFSTTINYSASVNLKAPNGDAIAYVDLSIAYENKNIVFSGLSDKNGNVSGTFTLPSFVKEVQLITRFPGLIDTVNIMLSGTLISYTYNSSQQTKTLAYINDITKGSVSGYTTLGSWDNNGYPSYLTTPDAISASLLQDIAATLPESKPLTQTHPQYLTSNASATIHLEKLCDVWVTFVTEGAGYRSSLGFYSYEDGNAPASASSITGKTIIYPNASLPGSGGNLASGSKVYIGRFNAGTNLDWFIIANGFISSSQLSTTNPIYYSQSSFNPEKNTANKKHVIVVYDSNRNLALLSFEDLNRENGSDQDFNDVIFYVTSNPVEAINKQSYIDNGQVIDTPKDTDGDGVSDTFDDYPTDPTKAKNNYSPSKTTFGSLAFEDLWPYKGDYDFNDLIVDYQFNSITNASNKVVEIDSKIVVRAIGASYHNGFGIELPVAANTVSKVTGQRLNKGIVTNLNSGVESGQNKAVIMVFDDAYNILPFAGGNYVNTIQSSTFVPYDTISLKITFTTPQSISQSAPYNPFIFINGERGKEVHLAGYTPTNLVNYQYFSTGNDKTSVINNKYYISDKNLPWAINLPESFSYPFEKVPITSAYNYFGSWAQSAGVSYTDWYRNNQGYRNVTNIFSK